MENGQRFNSSLRPVDRYDVGHVQEVIRQAHDELRQLLQQRAEIMKRIGTVKQTISGFNQASRRLVA
jgi:chorismate mutase